MSRRFLATFAVLAAAAALAAASFAATTARCSTPGDEAAPPTGDYKKVDVFRGALSEKQVHLKAGQAKHVSFVFRPMKTAPDVRVRVTMPAELVALTAGPEVWKGSVGKGQTKRLDYTIVAGEHVRAAVRVDVEAPPYGTGDTSTYYLDVSTMPGGPTTDQKTGNVVVPAVTVAPPATASATHEARGAGTITIKVRWMYVNETGGVSPMRQTAVALMDEDGATDETVATAKTDYDGRVTFTVDNDDGLLEGGRDPYLLVYSENGCAFCKSGGGGTYAAMTGQAGGNVPDGYSYDYGTLTAGGYNEAWQLIDAVTSERDWVWSRSSPNWQRSQKIAIQWPVGTWPTTYAGSLIWMPSKSVAGWDHAVTHHEYAHCIMWALYGDVPAGAGPSPHYLNSESSPGFAMKEGWAEFMQAAVDGRPQNVSSGGQNIETNDWYNRKDAGDMDGESVEGSVASILWDVIDPTSAPDRDTLYASFTKVFQVMRDDKPQNMSEFWTHYTARWPDLASSAGPLSDIYWQYGVNKDLYAPFGVSTPISLTSPQGVPGWTRTTRVTANVRARDYGSGVAEMRFANGTWSALAAWMPYASSAAWTLTPGDGTKTVWVQFRDEVDHDSGAYSASIKLDGTVPTGSVVINGGAATCASTAVTLTLAAADGAGCGVKAYRVWNAGSTTPAVWKDFTAGAVAWTLTSSPGLKRVYVQYMDRVGNVSTAYPDAIELRVPTSLTASTAAVVPYGGKATVTGVLKTTSGTLLDGKTVTLISRAPGGSWATAASTTTAGGGKYTFTSSALGTSRYFGVRFAGDSTCAPASGPALLVTPKAWVTAPTAPATPQKGVAFVSDSFLKPRHNAASSALLLQCLHYEKKADNTYGYVLKSTVGMTAADYLAYSRCSASLSLSLTGKWALRAYHAADAANAATFSTFTYITVN